MRGKASIASRLLCVLFLLLFSRTAVAVSIIYVDANAPGANNGSSWENAYVFLQDALADVNSVEKPVEIRVAQGIYTPDQGFWQISGDKRTYFRLINEVAIIGGFAGLSEADPNARDIECYKTILSGDLEGNDAEVNDPCDLYGPTRADNCRNVVVCSNTDTTAVLDGLTITGGHSTMIGIDSLFGGAGMIIYSGNPTLINCIFTYNSASQVGGGLRNSGGSPTLIGCTFSKNKGGRGGGMFNYNNSDPTLTNCIFHNNVARSNGGGIYNHNSNSTLTNCILSMNTAQGQGGGMHNIFHSNPIVTNCIFRYNRAHSSGGGMYNKESSPMVANCIFEGNSTTERTAWYLYKGGGGIYNYSKCSPTFINCTFAGNSAISGNTFACDSSQQNNPSNIKLTNCILWDSGDEISNVDGSIINITYSTSKALWPGEGNIDVDPCFAGPGYRADADDPNIVAEPNDPNAVWIDGDYHLKSQTGRWDPASESWVIDDLTSPCIDAGDPNSPIDHESFPNGGIINMGAYGGTAEASLSFLTDSDNKSTNSNNNDGD